MIEVDICLRFGNNAWRMHGKAPSMNFQVEVGRGGAHARAPNATPKANMKKCKIPTC